MFCAVAVAVLFFSSFFSDDTERIQFTVLSALYTIRSVLSRFILLPSLLV